MSPARTLAVFRRELVFQLRRPLFWIWLLLVVLLTWGLSQGTVRIQSGDASVGGTKAWITSEFALAQTFAMIVPLLYTFFVSVAAGTAVLRDEELGVDALLHATPLRPGEYLWGKFLAVLAVIVLVLAAQVVLAASFNHALVDAASSEIVGPFAWANYLLPAAWFALPAVLATAGAAFAVGTRSRSVISVFVLPVVVLATCVFFLWTYTPTWLDPRIDRALMLVDPTGFRWLDRTWLAVDRGVDFYNSARIGIDPGFAVSRAAFVLLGLLAVLWTQRRYSPVAREGKVRAKASQAEEPPRPAPAAGAPPGASSLAELGMRTRRPLPLAGFLRVLRVELHELRAQPGLYLFAPLILLQTVGNALIQEGPFGTQVYPTSGTLAVRGLPVLTFLLALLLLFYTVESLRRERRLGLAPLLDATPLRSSAVVLAKVLANALVGAVVVLMAFLGSWIALAYRGAFPLEPRPFLLVWGALLVPTLLVWSAFVAFLYAATRNAWATYGLALAALVGTGWLATQGDMDWARNWPLWSSLRWSDFGVFPLDREALVLDRALVLAGTLLFGVLALRLAPRREPDPQRTLLRLRPRALARSALLFSPFALPALALYVWTQDRVDHGWQGEYADKEQKDYWRKYVQTWTDAPEPDIAGVDVHLTLDPARRHLRSEGSMTLVNLTGAPLRTFALTGDREWTDVDWTFGAESYDVDASNQLYVFRPAVPIAPDATTTIGFSLERVMHDGLSKNGGGAMEFVLPEAVVLGSFRPSFMPVVGFVEGVGVDDDNRSDAKEYPDDFYVGDTPSAYGAGAPFPVRLEVTAPEEYTVNGPGVLEQDEVADGLRTVVWRSDHPVSFFNVIASRWDVARGEGTAIYYLPAHARAVPELLSTLDAARKHYSEWFGDYPWALLKLSEFPDLARYAQGFATNITFSEGIGFLARPTDEVDAPFFVTAHESAHQWWGNLLVPGKGPGGNVLSEGMAHFSTILLFEAEKGEAARIAFCKRIEERYGESRVADSERALYRMDGTRPGDTTVTYDKGGWVFWMLLDLMGRDACLEGMRSFLATYSTARDHPVLQDFTAHMRGFAPDPGAFDAFVGQWFADVVVPEYRLADVQRTGSGPWEVALTITNAGTGTMPVDVAALAGDYPPAKPDDAGGAPQGTAPGTADAPVEGVLAAEQHGAPDPPPARGDARVTVVLGPGESRTVTIPCDFRPDRVEVDPDARVLQLDRKHAVHRF